MKILIIAKAGLKECARYRILYFIFVMAVIFILMGKACNPGEIRGNDIFMNQQTRQNLAVSVAFHGIVLWSLMLSCLLSANMLSREIEAGTAILVLSRPVSRAALIAGKLLAALAVASLNMFLLCTIFMILFYMETGIIQFRIFIGCGLMLAGLLMYSMMGLLASLVLSRILAPLVCGIVYAISLWSALPFYYQKIRIIWIPSETVFALHRFLPRFGDLQFGGAALIHFNISWQGLLPAMISTGLYCTVIWCAMLVIFGRKEIA